MSNNMKTIQSIQELVNSIKEDCVFTTKCFAELLKTENLSPPEQAILLKKLLLEVENYKKQSSTKSGCDFMIYEINKKQYDLAKLL